MTSVDNFMKLVLTYSTRNLWCRPWMRKMSHAKYNNLYHIYFKR